MNSHLPSLLLAGATVVAATPVASQDREVLAMGTRLAIHLEGGSSAASEALIAEVARIEAETSTWRPDSAWSRLNGAAGAPVRLSREWIHLLAVVQDWNRRTAGAFDPMLGALMAAWGIRTGGREPSAAELAAARTASGSALLHLDPQAGTARLGHPRASLEEGGFLKGYALDAAARMARSRGAQVGLVDFGGQLLAWGRAFDVTIAAPEDRQQPRLGLRLSNASLSSSGCSERGRHILDPRSGRPCSNWGAAAVVAPRGLDADVLSTALYVMGPDEGLAWAKTHGVAAAFLFANGSVRMTPAFRRLKPTFIHPEPP